MTINNNALIFASEIKAIFQYPGVEKILDSQGLSELFGIGPAHTPGTTIFNNIFELKPAHYAIFNRYGLHIEKYWSLGFTLKIKYHLDEKSSDDNIIYHVTEEEFLLLNKFRVWSWIE